MNFRGIEARLGWKTEETDQCLAERFEWAEQGDYARVCSILEKAVYGGCELEAYEMRTLYYFLEKISAADTTDDWKIRIKSLLLLWYSVLINVSVGHPDCLK